MHIVVLDEDKLDEIVALANRMTDGIVSGGGSHGEEMHRLVAGADLVWGVWQEKRAPHGVRTAIIKGLDIVKATAASDYGRAVQVAALRFRHAVEAQAACNILGDDRAAA